MSFSLNKQLIEGNLGRNPEVLGSEGKQIDILNIATSEHWRDKGTGDWKELTTWHRVVLRDSDIEYAVNNLATGDRVYVEGVTRHRKWVDKEGVQRTVTEVHAHVLRLHTKAQPRSGDEPSAPARAPAQRPAERPRAEPQRSEDPAAPDSQQGDNGFMDEDPTNFRF